MEKTQRGSSHPRIVPTQTNLKLNDKWLEEEGKKVEEDHDDETTE